MKLSKTQLQEMIKSIVKEQLDNAEPEEEGLKLFYAYVPANLFKGKYFDYGARRMPVAARDKSEVSDVMNSNKQVIIDKLEMARVPVGDKKRRLVPKPAEENVFFKSNYRVKAKEQYPGDKVKALVLDAGYQTFHVGKDGNLEPV